MIATSPSRATRLVSKAHRRVERMLPPLQAEPFEGPIEDIAHGRFPQANSNRRCRTWTPKRIVLGEILRAADPRQSRLKCSKQRRVSARAAAFTTARQVSHAQPPSCPTMVTPWQFTCAVLEPTPMGRPGSSLRTSAASAGSPFSLFSVPSSASGRYLAHQVPFDHSGQPNPGRLLPRSRL